MQEMSPAELQAERRWQALKQQRDNALDQVVVMAGIIGSLEAQLSKLQGQLQAAQENKGSPS